MRSPKLSKYEKETIIVFNEEEPTATIFTYNRKLRNKLQEIVKECNSKDGSKSGLFSVVFEDNFSGRYIIPKSLISIRKPRKKA